MIHERKNYDEVDFTKIKKKSLLQNILSRELNKNQIEENIFKRQIWHKSLI